MNKPITVARNEFITGVCEIVNKTGLPAFVAVDALGHVVAELQKLADAEYQRDLAAYQQARREGQPPEPIPAPASHPKPDPGKQTVVGFPKTPETHDKEG